MPAGHPVAFRRHKHVAGGERQGYRVIECVYDARVHPLRHSPFEQQHQFARRPQRVSDPRAIDPYRHKLPLGVRRDGKESQFVDFDVRLIAAAMQTHHQEICAAGMIALEPRGRPHNVIRCRHQNGLQ